MTDSEKLNLILEKMSNLDEKVSNLDEKVSNLDEKVSNLDEKVSNLDEKVNNLDEKVSNLDEKVNNLDEKVSNLEFQLQEVKEQTTQTSLILENEIRVNIMRVAEGHLDLARNLHEAVKIDNEKEMLVIRVNILETELRKIKERVDQIA